MSKTNRSEAKQFWDENDMLEDADMTGLNLLREMISPYWSTRVVTEPRSGQSMVVVDARKEMRRAS